MASLKYIVPALALAGHVAAQSTTSCAAASTFTIQNGGDASSISGCPTFTGSIALATDIAGNIDLGDVKAITGGLVASSNGPNLTSLTASKLTTIGQLFQLSGLTGLTTLSMPVLNAVHSIQWNAMPHLQTVQTNITMTTSLDIQDTGLTSLNGINLVEADTINIANNGFLNKLNMPLANVTTMLTISQNAQQLEAEFPDLIFAGAISVRNVSAVSFPALTAVNNSFGLYSNRFSSFSAPNLTTIGATLALVSNDQLSNVSFPELTVINGGLQVANNSALTAIDGFPVLKDVFGAAVLTGVFKNVTFPSIQEVEGLFTLLSTEDISDNCKYFNSIQGKDNIIRGAVHCNGTDASAAHQTNGTVGTGTGTSSGSSASPSSSKGAAAGLMVPTSAGVFGLLAVMFGML